MVVEQITSASGAPRDFIMNHVGAMGLADIAALPEPARCMAQNRRQLRLSATFSRQKPDRAGVTRVAM
jgi:hypothetical protein